MRLALPLLVGIYWAGAAAAGGFELASECPRTFEKLDDGTCQLVTLYSFYASPPGHGGLKANLPPPEKRYRPEEIDLGRYLFFDPILSAGKDMACSTCHDPARGFSDGLKRSVGSVELDRSAPTLWNSGFGRRFMWDGRAATLEQQAEMPLFNPKEMANTPERLTADLGASAGYRRLFDMVYGEGPSVRNVARALAAFESSLVSLNSRFDRYAHGDAGALSSAEIRGLNVFRGFVARCSQCHIPPLFTDNELAVVGAPADDRGHVDLGAGALDDDPFHQGAFKVPTLRNISRTAPYFQAGQFETLNEAVEFYNDTRGHAAPAGLDLKIHWHVHMTDGPKLSRGDVADIVAFLMSLDDETLLPAIPEKLPSGLPSILHETRAAAEGAARRQE